MATLSTAAYAEAYALHVDASIFNSTLRSLGNKAQQTGRDSYQEWASCVCRVGLYFIQPNLRTQSF
jgi:hypothetical protein